MREMLQLTLHVLFICSLEDEMFQKLNFGTEWAIRLILKISNDKDIPVEGVAIVKQVLQYGHIFSTFLLHLCVQKILPLLISSTIVNFSF